MERVNALSFACLYILNFQRHIFYLMRQCLKNFRLNYSLNFSNNCRLILSNSLNIGQNTTEIIAREFISLELNSKPSIFIFGVYDRSWIYTWVHHTHFLSTNLKIPIDNL